MHGDMLRDPAMGGMVQHMNADAALHEGAVRACGTRCSPSRRRRTDLPFMPAMWHAARGLALRRPRAGSTEAETERAAVAALKDDAVAQDALRLERQRRRRRSSRSRTRCCRARSSARSARADEAARHFAQAVALEDALTYMEPPDWPIPVRQLQGAALLAARTREGGRGGLSRRHEEVSRQRLVAVRPAGQPRAAGARQPKPRR